MKFRAFAAGAAIVIAIAAFANRKGQLDAPKPMQPVKAFTPWGDPDISGLFTTDDELGVPFERPAQFGDRQVVTAEEFSQRQTQSERQDEADREEFVAPRQGRGEGAGGTGPPAHWLERGKPSRR